MATRELYQIRNDKSTIKGGEAWMTKHLSETPHTYLDLINHQIDLDDMPRSERNNFWHGQWKAIEDALFRAEQEGVA